MTDATPTTSAVWFITGAARGMGIELARAALDAGHLVVGTTAHSPTPSTTTTPEPLPRSACRSTKGHLPCKESLPLSP